MMLSRKKILLYIFIVIFLIAIVVFYFATKKPQTGDSPAFKEINADSLIIELTTNYKQTDSIYSNKNLAIKGKIKEINTAGFHVFINAGGNATIDCSFDSLTFQKAKNNFQVNSTANIKGIYSGCNGCDPKTDDGMDMLNEIIVQLKTCTLNK